MRWVLSIIVAIGLNLPGAFAAADPASKENPLRIRVLSPRMGAEIPFGQDKVTIVVEVEDATEEGITLKKGIPVFDSPLDKNGKVNEVVKANVDLFLKNLVSVTTYRTPKKPFRRSAIVYQLTAVVRSAMLGGGCQVAIAPDYVPPGVTEVPAAGYNPGAEFEFRIGDSNLRTKPEDHFSPNVCIVVAPAPVP